MVPSTPKRMVWRVTEAPWRMEQRHLCCSCAALSWFCGLASSQYLKWFVTSENADIFGSVLSGEGGSEGGGWRCCWSAPGLPQLPPATPRTHPLSLLVCCFFVFVEKGATSTVFRRLEVNLFFYEKRYNPGFSRFGILKILHSQPFAATYIHTDKAGS